MDSSERMVDNVGRPHRPLDANQKGFHKTISGIPWMPLLGTSSQAAVSNRQCVRSLFHSPRSTSRGRVGWRSLKHLEGCEPKCAQGGTRTSDEPRKSGTHLRPIVCPTVLACLQDSQPAHADTAIALPGTLVAC